MIERLRPDRLPNREPVWFAGDAVLALALAYLAIGQARTDANVETFGPVTGLTWILVVGPIALVVVRRALPASSLVAATLIYLIGGFSHGEGNSLLAAPLLAYLVATTRPVRMSATIVSVCAAPVALTAFDGRGDISAIDAPIVLFFFAIGWVVGVQVRRSQLRQHELSEQAEATAEELAEVARRAVADERSRIARELHDAVGHAVNVMVVQAGAARLAVGDDRAAGALREIERVGRSALSDLDRMLGLLSGGDDVAPLEPAHGLGDLGRLVDGVRSAGADVHLDETCDGVIDPTLERPIGAAAYRIVQESLTNAVKHAGPARIDVSVRCDDDELVVSVIDDGRGAATVPARGGGRGIVGMRERVHVLGGRLVAGPRVGGGFGVEAHFPRTKEAR